MSSIRIKKVHYRRCTFTPSDEFINLQSLLEQAITKTQQPWRHNIGIGGHKVHHLCEALPRQGCLCGELSQYEFNRLVQLIDTDEKGGTWRGEAEPKDGEGKKRNQHECSLFFAIKENHLAIIQTQELTILNLQDFFVKFLQTDASLIPKTALELVNIPTRSAIEKLKDAPVKSLQVGTSLFSKVTTDLPLEGETGKTHKTKKVHTIETNNVCTQILAAFGVKKEIVENLAACGDPGSIKFQLKIGYASRSEKEGRNLVNGLAASFGVIEGLNTTVQLANKATIKNGELTIQDEIKIQAPGGNLSSDDAFTRLSEWLNGQIKSGNV
jgi:hypothetical protein